MKICLFPGDFARPKIVYPDMTKYLPFAYDEEGYMTNQKCFILTGEHMAYLTAFFNSSLFKYCFRDSFPELQGGTRELSKIFFDRIAVKKVSAEINERFRKMVNEIRSGYSRGKAVEVDNAVFDLYGLTASERETIGFVEIK